MSSILSIAHTPPAVVTVGATVSEAVSAMVAGKVGAVAVLEGNALAGLFTDRDLMNRVVHEGRDPDATPVADVMNRDLEPLTPTCTRGKAFRIMTAEDLRQMPICDADRNVLGILPIREVLFDHVEALAGELDSLEAYLSADGPGG